MTSSTVTHGSQAGLTNSSTSAKYSRIGPSYETINSLTMRQQLVAGRNVAALARLELSERYEFQEHTW